MHLFVQSVKSNKDRISDKKGLTVRLLCSQQLNDELRTINWLFLSFLMPLESPAEQLKLFSIETQLEETLVNEISRNDVLAVT